jgi:LuxR family maltose regulon positive regulatory protein
MTTLLRALEKTGVARGYIARLVQAITPAVHRTTAAPQGLVEPLSERELEVLRLLGTDLDGPAIARHLVVSLSTVRTHTKNIYAKLGVNNRRAAVTRAADLNLPAPHPPTSPADPTR